MTQNSRNYFQSFAEAESKFVNYVNMANRSVTELEQCKVTDFRERFNEFYMANYEPIANKIDSEIERFSSNWEKIYRRA